jgi:AcrR family transcriptional regulator
MGASIYSRRGASPSMRSQKPRSEKVRARKPAPRTAARASTARPAKPAKLREQARGQARDVFRVAILEAAERVFARRGFVESKVADIAREAGMAAGTLYNYFDSKDAIYQSICELRGEEALSQSRAIADSDAPPLARLRRLIEWVLDHLDTHADQFQMHLAMRATAEWEMKQVHGEAALANYLQHIALMARVIGDAQRAGELRRDAAAEDLAWALAGITNGFIHAWILAKPDARLTTRAPVIFDLFCKGAAPR